MTAFCIGQTTPHPYDNAGFEKIYATLRQPSGQVVENVTLREAMKSLANGLRSTVWFDRRIDGEQLVSLAAGQRSHLETIRLLTSQTNTEIAWLENVIYIAPVGYAARIEDAYWDLTTNREAIFFRQFVPPMEWKTSVETTEVLSKLSKLRPVKIDGLDTLPYDRWREFILPGGSLAAQWSCVLAGFNRTLAKSSLGKWEVVEVPEHIDVDFDYSNLTKKYTTLVLKEWKSRWPNVVVQPIGNGRFKIKGPVASHRELITMALDQKLPVNEKQDPKDLVRYTLTLQGTIGDKLPQIAKQLDLELWPWPLANETMNRRIEVEVNEATLDEMLITIADKAKLIFQREDKIIKIQSKP